MIYGRVMKLKFYVIKGVSLLHLENYIIDKILILISISLCSLIILLILILAYQTNMETESTLSTSYLATITICTLCNGVFVSLIIWVVGIIFRVCCQYTYKYISYFVSYYPMRNHHFILLMVIFVSLILSEYSNQKKSQLLQREDSDARNSYQVGKRLLTLFTQVV